MKKNLFLFISSIIFFSVSVIGQNTEQLSQSTGKLDQSKLYNEFFASYGIGSMYIFSGTVDHSYSTYSSSYSSTSTDVRSAGSFLIGYNRMINRVVMIGFTASFMNLNYSRTFRSYEYYDGYVGTINYNDNVLSGIAKVTFNYVNKPMVRVYSGIAFGISVDLSNAQGTKSGDTKEKDKKIFPAGQLTFMGVRFGRALGGFCEFGMGTNPIISAGISYQFGD